MKIRIEPGIAEGSVTAPPSKSYAHRLLLGAALCEGTSIITGVAQSEDILATLDCIAALGARYDRHGSVLTVHGGGAPAEREVVFPCRESGSTLRFFLPLALVRCGGGRFTGTRRLLERGIGVYESLFREKGVALRSDGEAVCVSGNLLPGEYTLTGDVSSQFVTGLLVALPLLDGASTLRVLPPVESRPYIDITLDMLKKFGIQISEPEPNIFHIPGSRRYRSITATAEGDWSNAAFLLALNRLGGNVSISGLNPDSIQGDRVCVELFRRLETPGAEIDISACLDLGPVLFAVAAARHGGFFTGTRRLSIKESDRASAMAEELAKLGAGLTVTENTVAVSPGPLHRPEQTLCGHNDHRIVMAMAVTASTVGAEIDGVEAVGKSYPDFFQVLSSLGLEVYNDI